VPSFRYAAKDNSGKTVQGTLQANDRAEAVNELRRQDLVVLRVEEGADKGSKSSKSGKAARGMQFSLFKPKPSATRQELVMFTRQLATMIGAGLSLLESLDVLEEQAESPGMKCACEILTSELRGGSDLSTAMALCPKAFNRLYISMVTAGEASGQMDVILERLAEYVEASDALRREIRSAMTYPVISLVLVLGITMFLMVGVVPGFKEIFEGLGTELPTLTRRVMAVSDWIRESWIVMIGAVFAFFAGFVVMKKTQSGTLFLDHLSLRVPIFGPLARKVALARFSRTFATLIRSGVPIMGTLEIVSDTAGNEVVAGVVRKARENVRNGEMLSEPLAESRVFPAMVTRMIAIGERSGALEALLEKIAEFYDAQVKAQIKALTSLIEPLLIVLMGGIVGFVVLAVFMPMLDIIGQVSG
jgi:type IV pilus assembly protein PilC